LPLTNEITSRMTASRDTDTAKRLDPLALDGRMIGMSELLDRLAARMPDGLAAIDERGSITYAGLRDRCEGLARAFVGQGISKGARVGLLCGNGIDWLTIAFATARAGATLVPFSTWSTRAELEFLFADADCRALFVTSDFGGRDFTQEVAAVARSDKPRLVAVDGKTRPGFTSFDAFAKGATGTPTAAGPDDDAMILYTSGSTSRPKGVRLKQAALVENGRHIGDRMGLVPGDRVFLPAPLFWAYGGCNALPAAMSHGATLVLPSRFEAGQALDLIEAHACSAIYTLPSITSALLRHAAFRPDRTKTLRTGLTIGSPEDVRSAVEDLNVPEICNVYGATETYGNCAVTWHHWPLSRRAVCQGPLLPGQTVRFRDLETGELCPLGVPGVAEVNGRISPGYFGQSEAENAKALTADGYYRTGDVGYLDGEGSFVFVGRDSEMIKRAGINVSPAEVEDVLRQATGVFAAAVTGVPDSDRGELIVAYVVGRGIRRDAIYAHCRAVLSKYKLPDRIEILDSLPLTNTGKLQRNVVKQMAIELLGAEATS